MKITSEMMEASPELMQRLELVGTHLLAEGFVWEGFLNPKHFSDEQLGLEIQKLIVSKFLKGEETLGLTFNHTNKLVKDAKRNFKKRDLDMTVLLYMLVIEHRVNRILRCFFRRQGTDDAHALQIVRKLSVREKSSWLFKMLGLPPMPKDLSSCLNTIEEYRNSFVHFKWVARYEKEDDAWTAILEVRAILKWIDKIENKEIFFGHRKRIARICVELCHKKIAPKPSK